MQLVPLFKQLPWEDQERIENLVHRRHFAKGEVVLRPGCPSQLVIVEHGRVHINRLNSDGATEFQGVMEGGDFTGQDWLFGHRNEDIFLEARSDTVVCTIPADAFHQLLVSQSELAYQLLRFTLDRDDRLQRQIHYLTLPRVEDRIRAYFADLGRQERSSRVHLSFSLAELASYLGTSPETLSRKMGQAQQEGSVLKLGHQWYQVNPRILPSLRPATSL
ncbi:transcriptional regulator [Parascardovia denticolens IPLA 20019]|nr:transcriptional regulator [Parascardovia denticolens IPLA 20019]